MTQCTHERNLTEEFKSLGRQLSNWGKWGPHDRLGTLNYITPDRLVAAAANIRRGIIFDLAVPLRNDGIQPGGFRNNPQHFMVATPADMASREDGLEVSDDCIIMPLQAATQWDGLGHVGYDGLMYNGVHSSSITSRGGSRELSIHQVAEKGIAGRGILLDIAGSQGVDRLPGDFVIEDSHLESAEARQGVRVQSGDILLIRTGWIRNYTVDASVAAYWNGNPGLHFRTAEWLHRREVAAVACDNWSVEYLAPITANMALPFHCIAIRDMGMTLGEIFDFEALCQDCASDGIWTCFLTAPPLKVVGGVGTPVTPLAIK